MTDAVLNVADLDGSNGFVIQGTDYFGDLGHSVSSAGDINGDGIDDLIIGAPLAYGYSYGYYAFGAGKSYVVFGSSDGFDEVFELETLDGSNGFVIQGINYNDSSGWSVSSAGDINGDGIDDLIIGALGVDTYYSYWAWDYSEGESYVVFGSNDGFDGVFELTDLDGSNGFAIRGVDSYGNLGRSVSSAGDINGDGIDDLIVGAPGAGTSYYGYYGSYYGTYSEGESYVIFGSSDEFNSFVNVLDLDGSNGFVIQGVDYYDNSGYSVSSAGDINGDGIDDLIIGAPDADTSYYGYYGYYNTYNAGESYVVFGSSDGFDAVFELANLDGTNGFVIEGIDYYDNSGYSVSSAGDINGDGIDDLIVSAPFADTSYYGYYGSYYNYDAGESYVIFGSSDGFDGVFELETLDGSNGFVIQGIDDYDNSGYSVSSAGDINGDGIDDLIIGASNAGSGYYGYYGYYNTYEGESYVVFGSSDGFDGVLDLATLDGTNGFVIEGVDSYGNFGYSVSSAGDINGDGADDLVIGAPNADGAYYNDEGKSYVIFGFVSQEITGTNRRDTLEGGTGNDTINGLGSHDFIDGGARIDIIDGGNGNDIIYGGEGDDEILGGSGRDSILGEQGNDIIDGGNHHDTIEGGEGDDFIDGGRHHDSILGGEGDDFIEGGDHHDTIEGGEGDDFIDGGRHHDSILGGEGDDFIDGGNNNDTINGGEGDDFIDGGSGHDRLSGVDSSTYGAGEVDILSGGTGRDTFVLGDEENVFYDDGLAFTTGEDDYAVITDFNSRHDKIELSGSAESYTLDLFSYGSGVINAAIIYDSGNLARGELIAIVEDVSANLDINDSAFKFLG